MVTYGGARVWTGATIRDPRAETAKGVGIGDNLELARRRYPGINCFVPLHAFNTPWCGFGGGYGGVDWPTVHFIGDPIEVIEVNAQCCH